MKWNAKIYAGAAGQAWVIDEILNAPQPELNATLASWIVEARWAHPVWYQYALSLVHLREGPGLQAATIHRAGLTHEFMLFALDPKRPLPVSHRFDFATGDLPYLIPANQGYQFPAESDAAAVTRVRNLVEAIADGTLNPDTDARQTWHKLFEDSAPLVKNIFAVGE